MPFCVDVRPDVMSDLAGTVAQPDALVERHGPDPQGHAVPSEFRGLPEANVMATAGIVANGLLEGEVLLPTEDKKAADGRIGIGPVTEHTTCDADAGFQCDRISGVPARADQGSNEFRFSPDQSDIEWVAGDALGCPCGLGGVFKGGLVLVVLPERGEYQISKQYPGDAEGDHHVQCSDQEPPSPRSRFRGVACCPNFGSWGSRFISISFVFCHAALVPGLRSVGYLLSS